MDEVAQRAVRESLVVKEYAARIRGDQAQLEEVEAQANPTLQFNTSYNHLTPTNSFAAGPTVIRTTVPDNYSLGLSLRQLISDFGRLESSAEASRLQRQVTRLQYQDQQDRVFEESKVDFHQAALAQELLQVAQDSVKARQAALDQARSQYKVGVVSRYDTLRAATALAEARQQLVEAESQQRQSLIRLCSRLNLDPDGPVALELNLSEPAQPAVRPALPQGGEQSSRRDLQAAWWAVSQARAQLESAYHYNGPRLDLQSDYAYRNATAIQTSQYWSIGLQLSAPLYDGGIRQSRVAQSQALVERLQANYEEQLRLAGVEARTRWEEVASTWHEIEQARAAVESAREAARVSRVRYRNGLNTNVELLDAEASLSDSEGRWRRARRNHQIALIHWARAAGAVHAVQEEVEK
ncbi:TolC family protein [bacterium]|nr:TolC family protein [bacterium]